MVQTQNGIPDSGKGSHQGIERGKPLNGNGNGNGKLVVVLSAILAAMLGANATAFGLWIYAGRDMVTQTYLKEHSPWFQDKNTVELRLQNHDNFVTDHNNVHLDLAKSLASFEKRQLRMEYNQLRIMERLSVKPMVGEESNQP